jgi:hypothetical protein
MQKPHNQNRLTLIFNLGINIDTKRNELKIILFLAFFNYYAESKE